MPKSRVESTKGTLKVTLKIDGAETNHELDKQLTIHDFKSLVLTHTGNKAFYLTTNICNTLSLADLVSQLR